MRYIFGAPEGLQRYAVQNHIRLNRTSGVLLTRLTPDGVGGLPGFLLTLADSPAAAASGVVDVASAGAGGPGLSLHGPSGTHLLLDAIRTYVNYRDLSLVASESAAVSRDAVEAEGPGASSATEGPVGADAMARLVATLGDAAVTNDLVDIHAVSIKSTSTRSNESGAAGAKRPRDATDGPNGDGVPPAHGAGSDPVASWPPPPPPAGSLLTIAATDVVPDACCYVCRLPDVPGKFLPQKAASLGVPRGPAYGKLTRGEAVVAANGRTVTPEDVMEPATPGPVLVVLDCPDESYLPALLESRALRACMDPELHGRVACIAHLAPASVLRDQRYRDWAAGFGPDATHLVPSLASTAGRPVMRGGAALQAKLNALDARFFPLPLSLAVPAQGDPSMADLEGFRGTAASADLLKYTVRPLARRGTDDSDVAEPVVAATVVSEAKEAAPEAFELADAARSAPPRDAPPSLASIAPGSAVLRVLGTGSAVPSKYRNVTSTAFDFGPGRGTLLADAGEGSVGQLERALGVDGTREFFSRLAFVWISHIHADHHVGLPLVLQTAELAGAPPPLVVGPRPLLRTLRGHLRAAPLRMRWIDSAVLCADPAYLGSVGRTSRAMPGTAPASGVEDWAVEDVQGDTPPEGEADPSAPSSPLASPTAGSKRSRPWDGLPSGAAAILAAVRERLGLSLLGCVAVQHCSHATGLVLHSKDGWRIVLSGDTRPCRAVALAARGVDLLVHEATFEASMAADAKAKNHSTIGEALSVAARAKPFVTLLTHFSQRYPRVPDFEGVAEGDAKALENKLAIAFDQMKIDLADLPVIHTTLKPVSELLKEDEEAADADEE